MKRFIAVLICIFMLVSLLPAFAFAEEVTPDPAMQEDNNGGNNEEVTEPLLTQPAELEKKIEQPAELEKKDLQLGETEQKLVQSEEPEKKLEQKLDPIVLTDNGEGGQQNGGGEPPATYSVTVSATPAAGGTVTGANTYEENANVTVTATANTGYRFVGWKEGGNFIDGATANTYTFVATKDRKIVAAFELDVGENKYRITAVASPAQGGSVTGAGDYEAGTTVTLTATANEGYKFAGWKEGGNPIGEATGNTYTFVAAKGRHIVAEFVEEDVKDGEYRITAVASPAQGGSVTGAGDYEAGATVTLTATASEGYKFAGWKEGGNPIGEATGNPYTFVAAKGRHIVAEFVEEDVADGKYRITAVASPAQGGSVTGAGDYGVDETVTLTATASEGYKFAGWKEGGNPIGEATGNPYTFVAAKGRHIVAVFEKINESIPTKTTIKVSDSKVTYGKPLTITVSVSSALNYSGMLELRINGKNYGEPQDIGNDGEVTWKISASKSYGFKLGDNKIETVYIGAQDAASLLPVAATVKVTSACKPQPVCKPTHYCCGQNHFTGKCVTVRSGEDVTFKVELGCNESCQWYVNRGDGCGFVKIKGATCPTLTVKDVTHKQDGYRYRCVIRNCCETIRTPIFTLNVASGQLYTPKTGDSSGIGLAIAIAAMGVCLPAVRRREDRS